MSAFDSDRFTAGLPALPSHARKLAVALAGHADPFGEFDGSAGWLRFQIGKPLGLAATRVDHAVKSLREAGVLHLVRRGDGLGRPTRWALSMAAPVTSSERAFCAVAANAAQ